MPYPSQKRFRLSASQIKPLAVGYGGCIASDQITVDGKRVGYMYRLPTNRNDDSGWCFLSGYESQAFMDDSANHEIYDVNTIANYDPGIIPFLDAPAKSAFARKELTGAFEEVPYDIPEE